MGMRRSVWICIGTAVGVLLLAVFFRGIDQGQDTVRYHQHLEQPSEAQLGPCQICGGNAQLCTHLPIISITTGGQKIPGRGLLNPDGTVAGYELGDHGEEEILVDYYTFSQEGVYHHPTDEPTIKGQAMMRIRGNSSRRFDKSSYQLSLIEDTPENAVRRPLLGMARGKEWALYGPFLDKTLIRNYMCMNLSGEIMNCASEVRFCEVLLDGEYRGLYVLMQSISSAVQDKWLPLTEYQDGDPVFSYLVRLNSHGNPVKQLDNFTYYTNRMEMRTRLEIVYPSLSHQTQQVKEYIQTDFSEMEKKLYSLEMYSGMATWRDEIDMESFVNYYILQEFLAVNDTFSASTYFYRDVRGKLHAGPVWDFNNALDNFFQPMPDDEFILSQRSWFAQLMNDEDFVERVISRYRELRKGLLSDDYLLAYVQATEDWLGSAIDRNFEVWGYSFDPYKLDSSNRRQPEPGSEANLEDVNPSSHEEAVEWMNDFMLDRAHWLDSHIQTLRQYCHPSKNAVRAIG